MATHDVTTQVYTFRRKGADETLDVVGPTLFGLSVLDPLAAKARLIYRIGDARTGMSTYIVVPKETDR